MSWSLAILSGVAELTLHPSSDSSTAPTPTLPNVHNSTSTSITTRTNRLRCPSAGRGRASELGAALGEERGPSRCCSNRK